CLVARPFETYRANSFDLPDFAILWDAVRSKRETAGQRLWPELLNAYSSSVYFEPMLPFKLVYSDDYYLPIGAHVFPAEKYRLIKKQLLQTQIAAPEDCVVPQPASDEDILLVHTPDYVRKLKTGTLSPREEMLLEVPYSAELVRAFWLAAGGAILAAKNALQDRCAISVGGGFHHAFPDHGE